MDSKSARSAQKLESRRDEAEESPAVGRLPFPNSVARKSSRRTPHERMLDANVRFFCPCFQSPADTAGREDGEEEAGADGSQLLLADPRTKHALFPIEYLYFCDDCHVHRCPRCVTEEIVSIYCPHCLFEVPGKTGNTESHCRRSCFRCPSCLTSLGIIPDQQHGHILRCYHCHWSSGNHGFKFPRPAGLMAQIAAQRPDRRQEQFDRVQKHISDVQASQGTEFESEGARLLRKYRQTMEIQPKETVFTPSMICDEDEDDSTTSPSVPLRTPLRSKKIKRCRQCRLLLVKPDPKPLSTSFRSRLYANRVLPTISFTPLASDGVQAIIPHITIQWILKLTNPLPVSCKYTLSTHHLTEDKTRVVILCPSFVIGPNSEVWEDSAPSLTTPLHGGELYAQGRNSASVALEIVPSDGASSPAPASSRDTASPFPRVIQIPVFVQVQFDAEDQVHKGVVEKREVAVWIVVETRKGAW